VVAVQQEVVQVLQVLAVLLQVLVPQVSAAVQLEAVLEMAHLAVAVAAEDLAQVQVQAVLEPKVVTEAADDNQAQITEAVAAAAWMEMVLQEAAVLVVLAELVYKIT
jgi:hypothetical protein